MFIIPYKNIFCTQIVYMTCFLCNEIIEEKHILAIPCFYRNACKAEYFFCSEKCKMKYKNDFCCQICNYDNNLKIIKCGENNLKLCDLYPGNFSCYEKSKTLFESDMKLNFQETECCFCKKKSVNNISINGIFECKICFDKQKNEAKKIVDLEE